MCSRSHIWLSVIVVGGDGTHLALKLIVANAADCFQLSSKATNALVTTNMPFLRLFAKYQDESVIFEELAQERDGTKSISERAIGEAFFPDDFFILVSVFNQAKIRC